MNKKTNNTSQKEVFIICEGQEDTDYIKKLISLNVWNTKLYKFKPINAKGAGKIVPMYNSYVQNGSSNQIVLIFCDTDRSPYEAFESIKKNLREIYGGDSAFNRVVIYANPCTMRIVLAHFENNLKIKTQNKTHNSALIERLTNVKDYKAHKKQISAICEKISVDNYKIMKANVKSSISKHYHDSKSTNFYIFLERFEGDDSRWIDEINKALNH